MSRSGPGASTNGQQASEGSDRRVGKLLEVLGSPRAMVPFDSEFVRKLARGTVAAITRFDPMLCGKVLRIAAAASLVEFLLTVAIVMMGLPSHSKCSLSQTPIVAYTTLLVLSGTITFYFIRSHSFVDAHRKKVVRGRATSAWV